MLHQIRKLRELKDRYGAEISVLSEIEESEQLDTLLIRELDESITSAINSSEGFFTDSASTSFITLLLANAYGQVLGHSLKEGMDISHLEKIFNKYKNIYTTESIDYDE